MTVETLEDRLAEVQAEFEIAGDWNDRYRLLVEWGEQIEPLAEQDRLPEHEVSGCSSPLWLRVRWVDGVLQVQGASPGILPQAMVGLLCRLFDGLEQLPPEVPPVLNELGLRRNLSPTRFLVLERMLERILATRNNP